MTNMKSYSIGYIQLFVFNTVYTYLFLYQRVQMNTVIFRHNCYRIADGLIIEGRPFFLATDIQNCLSQNGFKFNAEMRKYSYKNVCF